MTRPRGVAVPGYAAQPGEQRDLGEPRPDQSGPLSLVEDNQGCALIGRDHDVTDASSLMP